MNWIILVPMAAWAVERFLTVRGLKTKVPAGVNETLEAIATDAPGVPPGVKAAVDAYVAKKAREQIDRTLKQITGVSERLEASFERAGKLAEAAKTGDLSAMAKVVRDKAKGTE